MPSPIEQSETAARTTGASASEATRHRLTEAAERLFADHGYAETSVREITTEAGTNVASVNYHFGSKQGLYRQVFESRLAEMREQRTEAVASVVQQAERRGDAATVIEAFARAFMQPLTDPARARVMLRLFLREMSDPHLPRGMFIEQMAKPMQVLMVDAIRRACPSVTEQQAALCFHSLVGQLVHLLQVWKMMADADGEAGALMPQLEAGIDHVIRFTAAGLSTYAKDGVS